MKKNYLKPAIEEVRMGTTWLLAPSIGQIIPTKAKSRDTEEEDVDYEPTNSLWD